ncbi:MAG: CopG family transcriptional regulator [Sulfuricella sp.]|nr:CopG family transcriptional regulator [Sulfuricella sp.]
MRVNARLDDNLAYKLDYLVHAEGLSVSDVVKESIDRYYEAARASQSGALEIFEHNGFIGCAEGDADLSVNYKQSLSDSLQAKHGDR